MIAGAWESTKLRDSFVAHHAVWKGADKLLQEFDRLHPTGHYARVEVPQIQMNWYLPAGELGPVIIEVYGRSVGFGKVRNIQVRVCPLGDTIFSLPTGVLRIVDITTLQLNDDGDAIL